MPTIRMHVDGGAGDYHSGLARIPTIKAKYPEMDIYIYGQVFHKSHAIVEWMLKQYENQLSGYELRVFGKMYPKKNFDVSPVPDARDWVMFDWCDHPPETRQHFEISYPFITRTGINFSSVANNCGLHMMTTQGDMDFEHIGGMNMKRYWPKNKWLSLIQQLDMKYGFSEYQTFGAKNEDYGISQSESKVESVLGEDLDAVVAKILKTKLFIGTNSWLWQVAAYAGIPTVVLYFTNPQWIPIHYNDKMKNVRILTDRDIEPEQVMEAIGEIYKK